MIANKYPDSQLTMLPELLEQECDLDWHLISHQQN